MKRRGAFFLASVISIILIVDGDAGDWIKISNSFCRAVNFGSAILFIFVCIHEVLESIELLGFTKE